MKKLTILFLIIFLISCNNGGNMHNMTKRLDQLDKDELVAMVKNAKKEIDNENFSTAEVILKKAKGFVTDDEDENLLAETNTYYKNEKSAYEKKIQREKERERRRRAARNNSYSSSSSGSSGYKSITIHFSEISSSCCTRNHRLSVSSSDYSYTIGTSERTCFINSSHYVHGTFSFSYSVDEYTIDGTYEKTHRFRGSFYVDGSHKYYSVTCSDFNTQIRGH